MHIILSDLAQTVGLLLFVLAFILVLIYAMAPSNASRFRRASHLPLDDEDASE